MMSRREREDVLVRRAVTVETIPSGQPYELQEGELAQTTQALGGSFTLVVRGQLVRLTDAWQELLRRRAANTERMPNTTMLITTSMNTAHRAASR